MRPDNDPTRWVDRWPLHGLSVIDRTRIKAILLKSHAAYHRANFKDVYRFIGPMQQAFSQIAGVLFEARLLTVEILKNQLRLFVIESAISGNWLYFAQRDETQGEIFPGHFGNVYVWKTFNGQLQIVFTAEIAEWTGKLLEREAADATSASVSGEDRALYESSPAGPDEIPRLEVIEPLLNTFIGETKEPIPVWIKAYEGPHTGLIAYFSNTSGTFDQESMPALGVIARVVYTRTHGERFIVGACCWLDWPEQRIDFKPGETRKLVLAVVTEGDQTVFALENRREQVPVLGAYDPGIMPWPLGEFPFKAELVLIDDKGRTVFEAEFLLERDKDKIITARKVELAQVGADNSVQTSPSTNVPGNESEPIRDWRVAKWEDIQIRFLSDERIQISAPDHIETLNYAEFGFEDGRNEKPNQAWITLRTFAENQGIVKQPTSKGQSWRHIEKHVQKIRRVFQDYFGLTGDPLPFVKGTGYRAQFKIGCSQSYGT